MDQQVIGVLGGTGQQGGSVIQELLKAKKYKIRTLTRNKSTDAAKKLQAQGVDVYEGNINDRESVKKVMTGCYGIYAVTQFFDPEQYIHWRDEIELKQGNMLSDIADETGVQVYIWSTLPNAEKISKGKYAVEHFTQKAKVDEYIRSKPHRYKYIAVLASAYNENFFTYWAPQEHDNTYTFNFPSTSTALYSQFAVAETGRVISEVLENVEKYENKCIDMVGERITLCDIVKQYGEVRGKKAVLNELTDEKYLSFFPAYQHEYAHQCLGMLRYFDEFGYGDKAGIGHEIDGKDIVPLSTWRQWLEKTFKPQEESKA